MHVIIEQMFIMRYGQHMQAGIRISCDHGKSWVVRSKRDLVFKQDEVKSFESRNRELTMREYSWRLVRQHSVMLEMVMAS